MTHPIVMEKRFYFLPPFRGFLNSHNKFYTTLWSLLDPHYLSQKIINEIEKDTNELWLSPISLWETLILSEKGRIHLDPNPFVWIENALEMVPIHEAPINNEIALHSRRISLPHQDPADRFIVATACIYDLTLITADTRLFQAKEISFLFNE